MDINSIMARAQKLMLDEGFNEKVEQIAAQKAGRQYKPSNKKIDYEGVQLIQEDTQQKAQNRLKNSKLEKSLLESFMENPPMSGDEYFQSQQTSALDGLMLGETRTPSVSAPAAPQPQYSSQPVIDYGIIKHLINEAIKDNMKSILNESELTSFRGMRIKDGNVFQFIDNKGNLWEGVLKLKQKAKSK